MKCLAIMLSLFACLASYAGGGYTLTGGLAKAIGEGSDDVNMGFNLGGSLYGLVSPMVGLGGEFRLNSWSFDIPPGMGDLSVTLQYYEFLFTPVIIVPLESNVKLAFQPGIGFFNGVVQISGGGESDSDSEADFGISLQGQLMIAHFILQPAFKIVFTEYETTKWLDLNIGYQKEF